MLNDTLEDIAGFWLAKKECSFHVTPVQNGNTSAILLAFGLIYSRLFIPHYNRNNVIT